MWSELELLELHLAAGSLTCSSGEVYCLVAGGFFLSSSLVLSSSFIKNLIIKASLLFADRNTADVNLDALVYF